MNHKTINKALSIILFLTAALFTYGLSAGLDFEFMLATSFTGVIATIMIALNEKAKHTNH